MGRIRRLAGVLVLVGLLAGCRVDAHVRAVLGGDGTGYVAATVRLDGEAVQRVERGGRTLETAIPLDDLSSAGWEVRQWQRADLGATIEVRHDFAGEDELNVRLAELTGTTGVARDARIVDDRGLLRSRDEIAFTGDLSEVGAGIAGDPELVASLAAAGLDVDELADGLDAELREGLRLRVTAQAPEGELDSVQLEPGEERRVTAARSSLDTNRLVLFAIAAILAFLGVLLYLAASVTARRDRAPRREPDRRPLM